jgi:hypothetical protein
MFCLHIERGIYPLTLSDYNIGIVIPMFTLTRKDIRDYGTQHSYAQMMFVGAGDDYVSARCLSFNLLMASGFPLFSQAIEKFLKAIIFLETGKRSTLVGIDRHNPYLLKQELQQGTDYDLNRYDDILNKLYGHFQHRYFDNKDKSNGMGTNELDGFDELWMHLYKRVPFPIEVKYRLKFPAMLFDKDITRQMPTYRHWVIFQNKAIAPMLNEMNKTYLAVKDHYINSIS